MRLYTNFSAIAFTALFMTACASLPPPKCVAFGHGGQVCLLPPSQLPTIDGFHMVTIDQGGKRQTFIGQLHIDTHVIRLAGSSLFGTSLFTVSYDGQTLHSESMIGSQHADLLIAILELVAANKQALEPELHGLTLTVDTHSDGSQVRELFEHSRLIAHMEIGGGSLKQAIIRFDIPPAHISVLMRPLASQP
jgi:hypothetical protein